MISGPNNKALIDVLLDDILDCSDEELADYGDCEMQKMGVLMVDDELDTRLDKFAAEAYAGAVVRRISRKVDPSEIKD